MGEAQRGWAGPDGREADHGLRQDVDHDATDVDEHARRRLVLDRLVEQQVDPGAGQGEPEGQRHVGEQPDDERPSR